MPQRFLVPQFLDVETKIIGPITTRQFIIMMISGMIDFIFFRLFLFNVFLGLTILNTVIFGIIAFLRINGMPFHFFVINLIQTLRRPNRRVWEKSELKKIVKKEDKKEVEPVTKVVPKQAPKTSRLSALSLMVDTGGAYKAESPEENKLTQKKK